MDDFGSFLGWCLVASYGLAMLNFFLKWFNRNFRSQLDNYPFIKKNMPLAMKIIVANHPLWGILTLLFLSLHFTLQSTTYFISKTGLVAATAMILQFLLGAYGTYIKKKKRTQWFYIHRILAFLLPFLILSHMLFKR